MFFITKELHLNKIYFVFIMVQDKSALLKLHQIKPDLAGQPQALRNTSNEEGLAALFFLPRDMARAPSGEFRK